MGSSMATRYTDEVLVQPATPVPWSRDSGYKLDVWVSGFCFIKDTNRTNPSCLGQVVIYNRADRHDKIIFIPNIIDTPMRGWDVEWGFFASYKFHLYFTFVVAVGFAVLDRVITEVRINQGI